MDADPEVITCWSPVPLRAAASESVGTWATIGRAWPLRHDVVDAERRSPDKYSKTG